MKQRLTKSCAKCQGGAFLGMLFCWISWRWVARPSLVGHSHLSNLHVPLGEEHVRTHPPPHLPGFTTSRWIDDENDEKNVRSSVVPDVPAWKVCSAFRGGEAPSWSWQLSWQPRVEEVVKLLKHKILASSTCRSWDFQPGLAQIRTAQTPGNGTAGGGPTKSKAASSSKNVRNSEKRASMATLEIRLPGDLLRLEVVVQGPHFQIKYDAIVMNVMEYDEIIWNQCQISLCFIHFIPHYTQNYRRAQNHADPEAVSTKGFELPDKSLPSKMQLRRMEAQNSLGSSSAMASCDMYCVVIFIDLFTWPALVSTKRRSRSRMPPTSVIWEKERIWYRKVHVQNSVVLRRQACHVTCLWKVEFDISSHV